MKIFIIILSFIVSHNLCATEARPVKVVTTFSVLKNMVEDIVGETKNIEIHSIVPINADPHIYQPTPNDSKLLAQADIVITNGFGFEGWFDRLIEASGFRCKAFRATNRITPRQMPDGSLDPHTWHSVKNAIIYIENIKDHLVAKLPKHAKAFSKNAKNLVSKLESLDVWIHCLFAQVKDEDRVVITTHDAFWYFGDAYSIEFKAPIGISTNAHPSAKDVANLIDFVKENQTKAIFIENLSDPKLVQQIASEAGVNITGVLYADSLSESDGPAATYFHMMKYNAISIYEAIMEGVKKKAACKLSKA